MPRKIPERTNYFLTQFTNRKAFHQLDMHCFYHFIQAAHEGGTNLTKYELKAVLLERGYTEEKSEWLSEIYYHGRELLANRISMTYSYPPAERRPPN